MASHNIMQWSDLYTCTGSIAFFYPEANLLFLKPLTNFTLQQKTIISSQHKLEKSSNFAIIYTNKRIYEKHRTGECNLEVGGLWVVRITSTFRLLLKFGVKQTTPGITEISKSTLIRVVQLSSDLHCPAKLKLINIRSVSSHLLVIETCSTSSTITKR